MMLLRMVAYLGQSTHRTLQLQEGEKMKTPKNGAPTRAMNIRGLDERFYNQFKQAVYKSGCKNVKEAVIKLMDALIQKANLS